MPRRSLLLIGLLAAVAAIGIASFRPSERFRESGANADAALPKSVASSSGATEAEAVTAEEGGAGVPAGAAGVPVDSAEVSLRFDTLRKGILAGDSSVLQDAKRYAVLGSLCAQYASMLNHATRDNESYRFARNFLGERCATLNLAIQISAEEVISLGDPLLLADEFVRQVDPDFSRVQSLANADFPAPDELDSRSSMLIDLILKADFYPTLSEALLAFAVDDERPAHPRMRLPFVEGLPGMGNVFDYRSSRFLGLVALQVACQDRIIDCGPNSLLAIQLCVYRDTCRNGVAVEDYVLDDYSGRQIVASRVAAQRVVAARVRSRGNT